ncbi:MAG: hypothetical protein ACNS60_13125 [Candidatus Cyclobacteriaceae bacterium M2_1C_046]
MDNKISTTVIYYTTVTFFALALCWALIAMLNWPALAEIPLAISIFIQILVLSRSAFNFWSEHKDHVLDVIANKVRATLFSLDTQEEEVNV